MLAANQHPNPIRAQLPRLENWEWHGIECALRWHSSLPTVPAGKWNPRAASRARIAASSLIVTENSRKLPTLSLSPDNTFPFLKPRATPDVRYYLLLEIPQRRQRDLRGLAFGVLLVQRSIGTQSHSQASTETQPLRKVRLIFSPAFRFVPFSGVRVFFASLCFFDTHNHVWLQSCWPFRFVYLGWTEAHRVPDEQGSANSTEAEHKTHLTQR
jgi:hypothetical protein